MDDFEQLVKDLSPRVFRYLARRVPAHADDLLSEVWLAAYRSRDTFRPDRGSAAAWVHGIARNVVATHLRRQSAQEAVAIAGADAVTDEWSEIDARLDARAVSRLLRDALAALPSEEREILLLVAWDELTPTEAATVLDIPAGTARSRLHRARTRLTTAWAGARPARGEAP